MHPTLDSLCQSLETLSQKVKQGWNGDVLLIENFGWHHPAIDRHDLADIPLQIANKLKILENINIEIEEDLLKELEGIPRKIQQLTNANLPYIFNGNGHQAIPAYMATLYWVEKTIEPLVNWQVMNDSKSMPSHIARRVQSLKDQIDEVAPEINQIDEKIKLIKSATEAAETLPTDLKRLKEARNKVDQFSTSSAELYGKIDTKAQEAQTALEHIKSCQETTDKLVAQCEDAYKITTTKGLAAAFDQRASKLAWSMWVWVFGLLIALAIGAYIGSHRLELLSTALNSTTPQWGIIWMQVALSVLSIGAPLWFAWMATKQIGQRFRLAEDYAFKASVAKAYEGYRKEAARIDEAFEARLFSSALTRLEEAPLR